MKGKKFIFSAFIIIVAVAALTGAAVYGFDGGERQLCRAAGIYDMLSPALVELYETEIAGESIISNISQSQLTRTANRLGITVEKLRAVLLLQDFAVKAGRSAGLDELSAMNDIQIISYAKQCADIYLSTLPQQRREELEQKLKAALKG